MLPIPISWLQVKRLRRVYKGSQGSIGYRTMDLGSKVRKKPLKFSLYFSDCYKSFEAWYEMVRVTVLSTKYIWAVASKNTTPLCHFTTPLWALVFCERYTHLMHADQHRVFKTVFLLFIHVYMYVYKTSKLCFSKSRCIWLFQTIFSNLCCDL